MRKILSLLVSSALLAASLTALSSTSALAETTLITCTDLVTPKTVILRVNQKNCKPLHATTIWHIEQSDSPAHSGAGYASLRTCTSKRTQFDYELLKSKCAKHQNTNDYWRTVAPLEIPIITSASARGYDSAVFALAVTKQNIDARIAYYLITNIQSGQINKVFPNNSDQLSLSNLSSLTSYTFTIAAVSVDGTSLSSSISPVITTGAAPVVVVASTAVPLAAPAFTLSSASETRTVNTSATGFTISSTGGAIASFAISATPVGMSFSTSTGALTGTPNTVAVATAYTITATNATGSATRTFTLTVTVVTCANGGTCIVGDRGPGGGIVYYVSAAPFTSAGSTCNTTCKYLEVAPATWQSAGVSVANDPLLVWSNNHTILTGQDITTASTQGIAALSTYEKFNWKIGQGFYNTSVMKVSGATSPAQAAVLAYAGTSVAGQWFIPSMNELNELCKYARGQSTGNPTVACVTGSGTFKSTANAGTDLGGFVADSSRYCSSSEFLANYAWGYTFSGGTRGGVQKATSTTAYVRPVRAF